MVFLGLILLFQVISLAVALLSVRRLYAYINRYRFNESVYTLLFGFVHLRYFVLLYLAAVAMVVCAESAFAFLLFAT